MGIFNLLEIKKEKYLLTWVCIGFISGILLYFFSPTFKAFLFLTFFVLSLLFVIRNLHFQIFLICALIGFFRVFLQVEYVSMLGLKPIMGEIILEGFVEEKIGERYLISIRNLVDSCNKNYKVKKKLLLSCTEKIESNSIIFCDAEIYGIQGPIVVKAPDYRLKYFFEGIIGGGQITKIRSIIKLKRNILKELLNKKIEENFSNVDADFIKAILFGEKSSSDENWTEKRKLFQKLGISHLLAISGLHFSLFSTIFYLIGRWIIGPLIIPGSISLQNFGLIFSLIGIIYYLTLANPSWSVVRSVIMFLIPIFLLFTSRRTNLYKNCIISLLILIIIWPYCIMDPGLQLSFLAVLTLSIFRGNLITSTARILFITAPFLLYSFRYISLQPFIASITCMPFFSFLIMPLITLCSFLGFPKILVFLLAKSIFLFFYIIYLIKDLFIIEIKLCLLDSGIIVWVISIFSWLLIKNTFMVLCGFICFLFSLYPMPKSVILISKSCKEVVIIDNEIAYSEDPESLYSKICSETFFVKKCEKISSEIKIDRTYFWKKFEIVFEKNNRLREIKYNGQVVLKAFNIISQRSPCMIDLYRMEAEFIDGSKLKL